MESDLKNCTFLKTVLMMIVVLGHSCAFWHDGWFNYAQPAFPSPIIGEIGPYLGTFNTAAFTFISGYIYYEIRHNRGGYSKLGGFILNKSRRLLVPYVAVCILWVIPIEGCFKNIEIFNFLFAISPSQLWFLIMLFGVFVMVYPFSSILKHNPIRSILLFSFLFIIGSVIDKFIPNIFQIQNILKFSSFFVLGFVVRHYKLHLSNKSLMSIGLICLIINLFTHFIVPKYLLMTGIIWTISRVSCSYLCQVSGVFMIVSLLMVVARYINWDNNKFARLSKLSFPIYLFHQQVIYFSIILLNGIFIPGIHALINFIVAILLSIVISHFFIKREKLQFLIGYK